MTKNEEYAEYKTFPIYSMKLAGLAMYKGFVLQSMEPDRNGSGRNVFYFKNSPELLEFIEEYKFLKAKQSKKIK